MSNEQNPDTESSGSAADPSTRVDPILEYLNVPDVDVDKNAIRDLFCKLWEYEKGEELDPEDQYLITVGVFIYTTHNILDDYNVRQDRAREYIVSALDQWISPQMDEMVAQERASDNPFRAFVENNVPRVDEIYTWKNFLLEHKTNDDSQWKYKMKKCWFSEFFIRLGRTDLIQTACQFDQIPWGKRKDYVDLKLENLFAKLGKLCQFSYKPAKKDS